MPAERRLFLINIVIGCNLSYGECMAAHHQHPTAASEFERRGRQQGLALTVQRRVIFEALTPRSDHPAADQVYGAVRDRLPGVSRTTVCRALEAPVGAGLVAKACHPGAAARYDPLVRRHHHLVCLRCEKIVDFEDVQLDALSVPRGRPRGFVINDLSVHFRGICADGRRPQGAPPRRAATKSSSGSRRKSTFTHRRRPKP
jgi:Fur family transcriptional regulator, peroxide stress response regulator